jgi:hypothetical protein
MSESNTANALLIDGDSGFPIQTHPDQRPTAATAEWLLDAVQPHTVAEGDRFAKGPTVDIVDSAEWETSAGPADRSARPRLHCGEFVYQGHGEPHWRGQRCFVARSGADGDDRLVIMACGCQAFVPWWTLEPSRVDIL